MAEESGDALIAEVIRNPSCVEDPKAWSFTRLKIAFEAIPEDFKKNHPCVKTTPAVLRQWFVEHGRNLPNPFGAGGGGGGGGGGGMPQQQAPPQQAQPQAQQFQQFQQQQPVMQQQNFDQYQQPGMMDPNMMGGMMGGMMDPNLMGGMGGFGYDMGGMGGMGDPNELMQMTRAKYNQIKERFNERDLELKQAHLQIQLMQLQIEKLESENRALKEGQMIGQPRQRRDTSSLFDL